MAHLGPVPTPGVHTAATPGTLQPRYNLLRHQYFPRPIATLPSLDQTSALGLLSATSRMFSLCFERRRLHVWAARCGPAGGDVMPPTSLQPDTSSKSRNLVTVTTQKYFSFLTILVKDECVSHSFTAIHANMKPRPETVAHRTRTNHLPGFQFLFCISQKSSLW